MEEPTSQPIKNQASQEESGVGSLIGILIIALVIIAGGVYFLFLK